MNRKTQKDDIIKHLKRRYYSSLDAVSIGTLKLSTRLGEYEREGYKVDRKLKWVKDRYGKSRQIMFYKIIGVQKNEQ